MAAFSRRRPIRGLSTIETALILPLCLLVLFGIIELSRLVADRQLLDNAAFQAAHLAAVSTTTLTTADLQTQVATCYTGHPTAPGLAVLVYQADPTSGQNVGVWTDAGRGDCIGVEATAVHSIILPMFGLLPNTVTLHAKSVVYSEGN